jgi:hypothetical protein
MKNLKATIISIVIALSACGHDYDLKTPVDKIHTGYGPLNSSTKIEKPDLPDQHTACVKSQGGDQKTAENFCRELEAARDPNILPAAYIACMQYTDGSPSCAVYLNSMYMPFYRY